MRLMKFLTFIVYLPQVIVQSAKQALYLNCLAFL
jgi:hypothetical protein